MNDLQVVNRDGKNKVDSRELAKTLGVKNHKQWLYDLVFANEMEFIKETCDPIDVDYDREQNKRGRPAKFVWFTEGQAFLAISRAKNSPKASKSKFWLTQYFMSLRKEDKEEKQMTTVWQERINKIAVPVIHDSQAGEVELFHPECLKCIEDKFSPDQKFIQFLSQLESETGYILPWDFKFDSVGVLTYPRQYKKYIDTYREITETDDARVLSMWGTEELPALPDEKYLVPANDIPPQGGVWLDEPPICKQMWREFVQCVREVVEVYNDPKRKEKYGIPSPHELETDYEDLEEDTTFLKKTLKAYNRFQRLYEQKHKVLGFQVHKDWLQWLQSEDKLAETMRQFYLGSTKDVYFPLIKYQDEYGYERHKATPGSFVIAYPCWADVKDGKSWSDAPTDHLTEMEPDPERNPDAPLFDTVRFYNEKYEPLFDWYIENIWLPQQGLKFFQATDPKGYPQLAMLLKDLPSNTALPKMFVQSVQRQLAASKS